MATKKTRMKPARPKKARDSRVRKSEHWTSMPTSQPLSLGTPVAFDIAQGLAVGEGVIREGHYDEGWLYRIDVTAGDRADSERHESGELWVCDFEVRPLGGAETP